MEDCYGELLEVADPEQLALELLCPYDDDGLAMRCVYSPTKATTLIADPQNLNHKNVDGNQVEFAIDKAIASFSKVDTRIAKIIESDKAHVVRGTSTYMLHIIRGLQKYRQASSTLDGLAKGLKRWLLQDGSLDNKELLRVLDRFVEASNPFKLLDDELRKANPNPKAALKNLEVLSKKYDKMIASGNNKRTMTAVAFGIVTIAFTILLSFKGPLVALAVSPLMAARASIDMTEASRKDKDDTIKEKRKGVAKKRESLSSYDLLMEDLGPHVDDYDRLRELIMKLRGKIVLVMDSECKNVEDNKSSLRRMVIDAKDEVGRVERKANNIGKEMEKVENLTAAADSDASATHIEQDLDKMEDYRSKKTKGPFGRRISRNKDGE